MKYLMTFLLFFTAIPLLNAQGDYKKDYKKAQKEGTTWVIILTMDG